MVRFFFPLGFLGLRKWSLLVWWDQGKLSSAMVFWHAGLYSASCGYFTVVSFLPKPFSGTKPTPKRKAARPTQPPSGSSLRVPRRRPLRARRWPSGNAAPAERFRSAQLVIIDVPGHPKECFLEVFGYLKPTKKHSFGCLGTYYLMNRCTSIWNRYKKQEMAIKKLKLSTVDSW